MVHDSLILKFMWKNEGQEQPRLQKEEPEQETYPVKYIQVFPTCYKAVVIKMHFYWHRKKNN